ncbi:MAG: hypothetical protein V1487_00595 [bacterium]
MTTELRQIILGFVKESQLSISIDAETGPVFMGWVMRLMADSNEVCNIAQYDGWKAKDLIWQNSELLRRDYSERQLQIVNKQVEPYLPALFDSLKANFPRKNS